MFLEAKVNFFFTNHAERDSFLWEGGELRGSFGGAFKTFGRFPKRFGDLPKAVG